MQALQLSYEPACTTQYIAASFYTILGHSIYPYYLVE